MSWGDEEEIELDEPCVCGCSKGIWQSNGGCGNPDCCGISVSDLVCRDCGEWLKLE